MKPAEIEVMRRGLAFLLAMAFVLLSVSCRSTHSSALDSRDGPKPIAVLLYTNALDVAGPTPRIAVYENGQVILTAWEKEGGRSLVRQHRSFLLTAVELDALRKQVHELAVVKPLRSSYEALDDSCLVMDASHARMYLHDGRHEAAVSVYALEFVLRERGRKMRPYEKGGPPPQFMGLYHRLKTLADTPPPAARRWTPRQVEVRLRDDFKHLDSQPVPWPKDWPALSSDHAHARGDHEWYVLLDGAELPELRRLLPYADNETAVLIDGKIWAACWRPILPGESGWWKAIMSSRR